MLNFRSSADQPGRKKDGPRCSLAQYRQSDIQYCATCIYRQVLPLYLTCPRPPTVRLCLTLTLCCTSLRQVCWLGRRLRWYSAF